MPFGDPELSAEIAINQSDLHRIVGVGGQASLISTRANALRPTPSA